MVEGGPTMVTYGGIWASSIGVTEIEKTKKSQSHQISAKVLILNAPPKSDIHTKNQPPSSKNVLGRACLRPWFLLAGGDLVR